MDVFTTSFIINFISLISYFIISYILQKLVISWVKII